MSQQLELLTENPSQWLPVITITPDIQKKEIKPFVVLALKELEGYPDSRLSSLANVEKFAAVREVVRFVARNRTAIKEPWTQEDIIMFLEGLRFTSECIVELTTLLCTDQIYQSLPRHLRVKPGLVNMKWKIDLSLSQKNLKTETSTIQRKEIMRRNTHVVLMLELTNGQTYVYRLSISKFHELRYTVAICLKSVIILEKRKCMRDD